MVGQLGRVETGLLLMVILPTAAEATPARLRTAAACNAAGGAVHQIDAVGSQNGREADRVPIVPILIDAPTSDR
jgi:hypothetical protein